MITTLKASVADRTGWPEAAVKYNMSQEIFQNSDPVK